MEMRLAQVQAALSARFEGNAETPVTGWSIDSRTLASGDLFFSVKGDTFDGHDFIRQVMDRNAAGIVASQAVDYRGNVFYVPDTLEALQKLAHYARRTWAKPVIAVTGSAGKTSTKDIIAALLSVRLRVGKTTGNLNNHLGLPLSLLRIPDNAEVAVVEMGMNHSGEIKQLCQIAAPDIGVVTNVGYAHVENFSSIEGVAAAKRELIESLPATGTAVLNADDARVFNFSLGHGGQTITYGVSTVADIRASDVRFTPVGSSFKVGVVEFQSSLSGQHNVSNILAGIAVAQLFGIEPASLTDAVAALVPGKMRGERHEWNGVTVLNDSYNSNPEAARHMLDVLATESASRRIAVLGEMRELGAMSRQLHHELGTYAVQSGKLDILIGIHGDADVMVKAAEVSGMSRDRALFFETPAAAGAFLKAEVRPGDAVLFKGSRGTRVELALAEMEAQS